MEWDEIVNEDCNDEEDDDYDDEYYDDPNSILGIMAIISFALCLLVLFLLLLR